MDFSLVHAAAAQHELGEVRLRLGDLDGAEEAFARPRSWARTRSPVSRCSGSRKGDAGRGPRVDPAEPGGGRFDGSRAPACCPLRPRSPSPPATAQTARAARDELRSSPNRSRRPRCARRASGRPGSLALLEDDPETASRSPRARPGIDGAPWAPRIETAKADARPRRGGSPAGRRDAAAVQLDAARAAFERLGADRDARRAAELAERLRQRGAVARPSGRSCSRTSSARPSLMGVIGDDAWDDLRRWHDQTLRASFADHGGEEIDHAGDGFFVAFPDAAVGPRLAVEIQRRLVEHRRAHGFAPQVRMGVHATAATHDEATTPASACTRPRGSAPWPGRGRSWRAPRRSAVLPARGRLGAPDVTAEGHRRAGRRGRGRMARLTLSDRRALTCTSDCPESSPPDTARRG